MRSAVQNVAVVGCGAIGTGIALEFALHGRRVVAHTRSRDSADRAYSRIGELLTGLVEVGLATGEQAHAARARVTTTTELDHAVADADYVVEAVPEDARLKRRVLAAVDAIAEPDVVLATATTALPVTELAAGCRHPHRVLATHYSLPAHLVPVVAVVPGEHTTPDAVKVASALLTELGKSPVVHDRDLPGTVGPRLQTALIGEALRLVAEGVADPETIDQVITGGIGRRFGVSGVFDRLDLAGLDTVAAVLTRQGRPVPPLIAEKVAAGHLGRRSGRGFYPWSAAQARAYDAAETRHLASYLLRDRRPSVPATPPRAARPVLVDPGALDGFLAAALHEYENCTPTRPPRCFAVLVGTVDDTVIRVRRAHFAESVRAEDPSARAEWSSAIVPCFGSAYANDHRGYWCRPADLLRISRQADSDGLDVLGSVHLHPDWHRIGPPAERGLRISGEPTPMDRYLFANTGWPVNLICYLERVPDGAGIVGHTIAAWAPPPREDPTIGCTRLSLLLPLAPAEPVR
jgi:3-hydroxyacyl-CoA dehydrogenase